MAYPVVEAIATGRSGSSDTTSHPITLPSNIQVGELLIVLFSCDGSQTFTATNGWTSLIAAAYSTTVKGAIFYKIADGNDSLTITTNIGEQSSHISMRVSGANKLVAASSTGSSTNPNPPALTIPDGTVEALLIATHSGDSTVVVTAAPTGYSGLTTIAAPSTGGASSGLAYRTATVSSENPSTFTASTEQWVSFTIAAYVAPPTFIPKIYFF